MALSLDDAIYGGRQTFDPAMAYAMVHQPELVIQHLANSGVEPPEKDFDPEEVSHPSFGAKLADATSTGSWAYPHEPAVLGAEGHPSMPTPRSPIPGVPSALAVEPPGRGGIGSDPDRNIPWQETPTPTPTPTPPPDTSTPPPPSGDTATWQGPLSIYQGPMEGGSTGYPTPPGEAASTGATPADDTSAKPGQGKSSALDDFAKAMAGLKKPDYTNLLHVSSPPPPRPTNPLSRSTTPALLMQEIAGLTHPQTVFRLGEALRGKAFA